MTAPARAYRLGYNTNGFAHHRLEDALHVMAELGYRAVALTPDANHLPPDRTTAAELRALRDLLERLDLAAVVETGARYVLDPRRKHRPTLLEPDAADRARRLAYLERCGEIAASLDATVVSFWSGVLPAGTTRDDAWTRLIDGVGEASRRLRALGVRAAFEPEPGMLAESLGDWERLRDAVSDPNLGLALDVGHVPCTETMTPAEAIRRHGAELLTVHLDDVRGRVHEHLQIGDGDIDWADVARALREVSFQGVAAFELSRHSHAAPQAAADAIARYTAADGARRENGA